MERDCLIRVNASPIDIFCRKVGVALSVLIEISIAQFRQNRNPISQRREKQINFLDQNNFSKLNQRNNCVHAVSEHHFDVTF